MDTNSLKQELNPIYLAFLKVLRDFEDSDAEQEAKDSRDRFDKGLFELVVVGELKKGKSSFINALLQHPLLVPVLSDVATSTVFRISFAPELKYTVYFAPQDANDNKASAPPPLEITATEVADYGTEDGNPGNKKGVDYIAVGFPNPLLMAGLVIVDTPGLGAVMREHSYITWRYVPKANALFFVLDSFEAVMGKPEADALRKFKEFTPHIYFIQTKADQNLEQAKAWQARNLEIIAPILEKQATDIRYFPVSNTLKEFADLAQSDDELEQSGFPPLLTFIEKRLMWLKQVQLALDVVEPIPIRLKNLQNSLERESEALKITHIDQLVGLAARYETIKLQLDSWIRDDYPSITRDFRDRHNDLCDETHQQIDKSIDPSRTGRIVKPFIDVALTMSAKDIDNRVSEIQSSCVDQCLTLANRIMEGYEQAVSELIDDTSDKLCRSYEDVVFKNSVSSSGSNIFISTDIPLVDSLNLRFNLFDKVRAGAMGVTIGGLVGKVVAGMIITVSWPAALLVVITSSIWGLFSGKKSIETQQQKEAVSKLEQLLCETVSKINRETHQQHRKEAKVLERQVCKEYESHSAIIRKEVAKQLKAVDAAKLRSTEENQARYLALDEQYRNLEQMAANAEAFCQRLQVEFD